MIAIREALSADCPRLMTIGSFLRHAAQRSNGEDEDDMDIDWVSLKDKASGKSILVNLANASSIWPIERGTEIWFPASAGPEGKIQVAQTITEIKEMFAEIRRSTRF